MEMGHSFLPYLGPPQKVKKLLQIEKEMKYDLVGQLHAGHGKGRHNGLYEVVRTSENLQAHQA